MAISAMLMLSSAMVQAQEVVLPTSPAPVIAPPATTETASVAAPTIVLPTPSAVAEPTEAAPVTSTPVANAPVAIAEPAPRRVAAQPASAARAPSALATDPTPVVAAVEPVPAPPVVETSGEPVAAAPALAPAESAATPTTDTAPDWALPVGLGASILVLGGVAMALRRRRRPYEDDVDFMPPVVVPPARPAMQRTVTSPRPTVAYAPTAATTPAVAPASASERETLLDRMVFAAPDAANPFTSRKARRRRARLILQSMPTQPNARTEAAPVRAEPRTPVFAPAERTLVDA
ncbi:MAG TPA: hypothetical protein PK823_16720 [Novosphingobium sp.]|nr:hypothetical protein [Novosphingobium sp.]